MKRLGMRGDTIIEVLLAIVVVSAVLSGAYLTSSRSLKNSRQAQERGEALKFVESQIEQIKEKTSLAAPQTDFCFVAGSIVTPSSNASCTVGSVPGGYRLKIAQVAPNSGAYTVTATWDSATGNGLDSIKMYYRVAG